MRCRVEPVICLALLASVGIAQEKRVDYQAAAQRVERLMPELAKQTGRKLLSSPSVANDVVVLSVKHISVDDLLGRIADVLAAEWQKDGDAMRLVRTREKEKEQEAAEVAQREKMIREAVDKLAQKTVAQPFDLDAAKKLIKDLRALDRRPDEDEDAPGGGLAEMRIAWALFDRSPANRALIRLLREADLKAIAAAPANFRVVFATQPNRFQRPLGPRALEAIDQLRAEQKVWKEAMKTWTRPEEVSFMGGDPRYSPMGDGPISKLVLSANTYSRVSEIMVEMVALDSAGKPLARAESRLPVAWTEEFLKANELISAPGKPDFELSERSLTFQRLQALPSNAFTKPAMTAEWLEVFEHPEITDPLSFGVSEALFEMAKRKGCNLVAAPTDSIGWLAYSTPNDGKLDLNALAAAARGRYDLDISSADGWMTVRQLHPAQTRLDRADRKSLAEFAQAIAAAGIPTLDAMANFTLKNQPESLWPFAFGYCSAVVPRSERMLQFADWSALKLYATLPVAQRSALDHGETIAAAMLPVASRDMLMHIVMTDSSGNPEGLRRVGQEQPNYGMGEVPSEMLAGMKLGEMRLSWKWAEEKAVVVATKGDERFTPWTHVVGASELGSMLSRKKGEDDNEYWFGSTRALTVKIFPTQDLFKLASLEDNRFNMRSPSLKYRELPEDFRAAVDKVKAESPGPSRPNRQPPP